MAVHQSISGIPAISRLAASALAITAAISASASAQTADTTAETSATAESTPAAPGGKPNVIIIFPDDVGWSNVSAYGHGVMGYTTPNIDKLAAEGAMFTEHYAQPSSTAGRAALITGQYPIRSGMTTVGLPAQNWA